MLVYLRRVIGDDGQLRRPWCAATRILEHREAQKQEAEAEEKRKGSSQRDPMARPPKPRHEGFSPLPVRLTSTPAGPCDIYFEGLCVHFEVHSCFVMHAHFCIPDLDQVFKCCTELQHPASRSLVY